MTYTGGTYRMGTLFRCTTSGILTVLVNFNDTNGAYPYGNLMQANDGNLYGMTKSQVPLAVIVVEIFLSVVCRDKITNLT